MPKWVKGLLLNVTKNNLTPSKEKERESGKKTHVCESRILRDIDGSFWDFWDREHK